MKKWIKVLTTGILATVLLVSLSACGSSDSAKGSDKDTIVMYQIGDKPEGFDKLLAKANETIEKETGAKLDMRFISWGDYDKKMSVMVSSGENYDIAFANNYVINAQKGAYADLTELLPKYAKEAYDQLDPAYIKGNSINGKLYAMPVNGNVFAQQVLTFNKQYLDKYNLDVSNVNTYADLEPLLATIKKNEKSVMPLAAGQGFKVEAELEYPIENGMPFAVDLKGDTTKIVNQFDTTELRDNLRAMHGFYKKGYIAQDAATNTTEYPLDGATWFARQETQGPYDYGDMLLTQVAGQELVSRPITNPSKTNAQSQMANFVVSSNSKNKEKAVEVLGVLNSNPDVLNTLVYGEEGKSWEKTDNGHAKILDGYKANNHLSAWNTGNNKILYPTANVTDDMIKTRDDSIANATQSPLLGFNVKTDSIKTELSNIANVMNQYIDGLNTGTLDPDKAIPEMNKKLEKAGYEKVRKELQKQYDAFLKENK
ncbi:ABC transporter substrate-binding protein [Listeria sp. ILCC792]|uniref:ABC transporter substrate-binding protein n=1 Tax=Listeria sp. ILCC792 TaxID=1918331 RepID=UPI000B587C35|nr:ABC transporter substrate-binding protein [Listeria sp. ILCC792]